MTSLCCSSSPPTTFLLDDYLPSANSKESLNFNNHVTSPTITIPNQGSERDTCTPDQDLSPRTLFVLNKITDISISPLKKDCTTIDKALSSSTKEQTEGVGTSTSTPKRIKTHKIRELHKKTHNRNSIPSITSESIESISGDSNNLPSFKGICSLLSKSFRGRTKCLQTILHRHTTLL